MDDIEDNNYFKLDKEFANSETCSLYELYAIFKGSQKTDDLNPILSKTKQYAERFNKYGFPETSDKTSTKAIELRKILNPPRNKFSTVEKAQLLDLLPLKAEEAFCLIPSIRDKVESEEEMQYYLDQLQKMASTISMDN